MVGTFDHTARIVALQAPEIAFRKIYLQVRVVLHCMFYIGDQLIVGISHKDTAKPGRQGVDVVAAVTAKYNVLFRGTEFLGHIFEGSLLGCTGGQEVQQPLPSCESKL